MDISTIKTIACIVPTENAEERNYVPKSFIPHSVTEKRIGQEYQLEMTVNDELHSWKVDRVASDLKEETIRLVDSAILGYDTACLSLSVSDEYKGAVNEKRLANLKAILDALKIRINNSNERITIEYAYIGIEDHECYDIRKGIPRSNISMIRRGMDSIMQVVESVDDISSIIEDFSTLPNILSIKLANNSKNTLGRLVIIDLLHPRFTPLLPGVKNSIHESFDYLRYIVEKITTPNCKEEFKTSSSVLTNEITKYICGNCKLIIVGYINDKIVNEIHSKETRALLSFVSSFKNIPVHALPNNTLQETFEYKSLCTEEKKERNLSDTLFSSNSKLKEQLSEKDITISQLETNLNYIKSEFTQNFDSLVASKEKKALLGIHDKQVQYLKATITSRTCLYNYDKLELNADIVRLKSMLDIKEFAEDDLLFESRSKKRRYQQLYIDITSKVGESEKEVDYLESSIKRLHKKLQDLKKQPPKKVTKPRKYTTKDIKIKDEPNVTEDPNLLETQDIIEDKIPSIHQDRTNPINEERKRKLEELKSAFEKSKERLKKTESEFETNKDKAKENFKKSEAVAKRKMEIIKEESKREISGIKETANQKMNALHRKYQDKLADQEREIESLKEELLKIRQSKKTRRK